MKILTLILLTLLPLYCNAGMSERAQAKQMVTAYLKQHGGAENILKKPPFDIGDRTLVCSVCHGKDGNSTQKNVPSLAAQNPIYFVEQLLVFKKGGRYPEMMRQMVKDMDDETMIAIALYFSANVRHQQYKNDSDGDPRGERIYKGYCLHCHGEDGTGANRSYAYIRAQRTDYLITTIKRFRDGDPKRSNHVMSSAAKGMSDEEIASLANYIAGL